MASVLNAGAGKADLLAVQLAVDRRDDIAVFDRAGDVLKGLFERDLALRRFSRCPGLWPGRSTGGRCTSWCSLRPVRSGPASNLPCRRSSTRCACRASNRGSSGRSFKLMLGSRNMVMTCAWEKSLSNKSAFMKLALSLTPSLAAFFSTARPCRGCIRCRELSSHAWRR